MTVDWVAPGVATDSPTAAPSITKQSVARIAGEALPPALAHLADGAFGEALAKAV